MKIILVILFSVVSISAFAKSKFQTKPSKTEEFFLNEFEEITMRVDGLIKNKNQGNLSQSEFNFLKRGWASAIHSIFLECSAYEKRSARTGIRGCGKNFNKALNRYYHFADAGIIAEDLNITNQAPQTMKEILAISSQRILKGQKKSAGKAPHGVEWTVKY